VADGLNTANHVKEVCIGHLSKAFGCDISKDMSNLLKNGLCVQSLL
jgi:hypothetical protein